MKYQFAVMYASGEGGVMPARPVKSAADLPHTGDTFAMPGNDVQYVVKWRDFIYMPDRENCIVNLRVEPIEPRAVITPLVDILPKRQPQDAS